MLKATTDGRTANSGLYASTSALDGRQRLAGCIDTHGRIDDVDERASAFEVAEELEAEPGTVAGALDETGHVGEHERVPARPARRHRDSGAAS